jgi:hypothetical protein
MVATFHPNMLLIHGNGRTLGSQRVLFGPDTGQPGLSNIRWQERVASGSDGWQDLELDSPASGGGGPPLDTEAVQDLVSEMFAAGTHTGATVAYDDTAGSLSIAVPAPPDVLDTLAAEAPADVGSQVVAPAAADWRGAGVEALLAAWQAYTSAGQIRVTVGLTQAAYDAIPSKDAHTLYYILD